MKKKLFSIIFIGLLLASALIGITEASAGASAPTRIWEFNKTGRVYNYNMNKTTSMNTYTDYKLKSEENGTNKYTIKVTNNVSNQLGVYVRNSMNGAIITSFTMNKGSKTVKFTAPAKTTQWYVQYNNAQKKLNFTSSMNQGH